MFSRRDLIRGAGAVTAALTSAVSAAAMSKVAMAALPEPVTQTKPDTMPLWCRSTAGPKTPLLRSTVGPCPGE